MVATDRNHESSTEGSITTESFVTTESATELSPEYFYGRWGHEISNLRRLLDVQLQDLVERSQQEIDQLATAVMGSPVLNKSNHHNSKDYVLIGVGPKIRKVMAKSTGMRKQMAINQSSPSDIPHVLSSTTSRSHKSEQTEQQSNLSKDVFARRRQEQIFHRQNNPLLPSCREEDEDEDEKDEENRDGCENEDTFEAKAQRNLSRRIFFPDDENKLIYDDNGSTSSACMENKDPASIKVISQSRAPMKSDSPESRGFRRFFEPLLERRREREESLKVQEKNPLKSGFDPVQPYDAGGKWEPISTGERKRFDAPGVRKSDNLNIDSRRPDAPENKLLISGESTSNQSIVLKNNESKVSASRTYQATQDESCQEQNILQQRIPATTSRSSFARRSRINELSKEDELGHGDLLDGIASNHVQSLDSGGLPGSGRATGVHFSRHKAKDFNSLILTGTDSGGYDLDRHVDTSILVKDTRLTDVSIENTEKLPLGDKGSDNNDSRLVPTEIVTRMDARSLQNPHCRRDFVASLKDHDTSDEKPLPKEELLVSCKNSTANNKSQSKCHLSVANDDVFRLEIVTDYLLTDPHGEKGRYSGFLIRGKPDGQGIMHYDDGRVYTGEWKRGRWHGNGKAVFTNGDIYTGEYEKDKRSGAGTYEWSDGRLYDGEFRDDQRQGMGIYSWPDGSVYKGSFHAGLRHGNGSYRFPDGSVYTGEFKEGKHHGFGELLWNDGRCYRGEWVNGCAEGHGIEIRMDGTTRHDGEWKRDRPIRNTRPKAPETGGRITCKATYR
jgi:hypothetical protein